MRVQLESRGFLRRNRIHLAFLAFLLLSLAGWNIYIGLNNDGIIRGMVVDVDGEPVEGAVVRIQEKTINLLKPPIVERSAPDGTFQYRDLEIIEFVISANKSGYKASDRKRYHLYFKMQNFTLPEPLVLSEESSEKE